MCWNRSSVKTRSERIFDLVLTDESPLREIDHINGIRSDNRVSNLREVSRSENSRNRRKLANTSSTYVGVSWCRANKKWHAQITVNGRVLHLGYFDSPEEASAKYQSKKKEVSSEPDLSKN